MSQHDHLRSPFRSGFGNGTLQAERPRVVIFESEGEPKVEILELPASASLGDSFCHCGTTWRVMATRTGDRVLIARPISA